MRKNLTLSRIHINYHEFKIVLKRKKGTNQKPKYLIFWNFSTIRLTLFSSINHQSSDLSIYYLILK